MYLEYGSREQGLRDKAIADMRSIIDTASTENRDTSAEDDARIAKFETEIEQRDVRIARYAKLATDEKRAAQVVSAIGDAAGGSGPATELRGDARIVANFLETARASRDARSFEAAFDMPIDMEKRAIADFSDNGALYTTDFSTKVAIYQRTVSPWINLASVINADNGRPINLPNLTVDPTTYTPGEGTAITEATPTIGSAALTTKAYKDISYISQEAEEDELVGLLPIIARVQGRSIGLAFGSDLTTTILTAATNGGTASGKGGGGGSAGTATNAFFGYEDLLDLKYSAAVPYRMVGVWIAANSAIKIMRKFKDGNGNYFWRPGLFGPGIADGQPDTFDGQPVYEDPYLATTASATKSIIYGDAAAVVIKQMGLRVATSTDARFINDQVALKSVYRAGGALPDTIALRYLVSANS